MALLETECEGEKNDSINAPFHVYLIESSFPGRF